MKLHTTAFAVTFGLFWGFGLFFLTWWIIAMQGVTNEVTLIGQVYLGYRVSPIGSVIGLAWGLVDGFVGGLIFAWLYNKVLGMLAKN